MPAFPIAVLAAVALLWGLARALIRKESPPVFLAPLALGAGQSMTEDMLAAGFATKSNSNRAFQRATGQTPSPWRALQGAQTLQVGRGGATLGA